jgi:hypothetical protein
VLHNYEAKERELLVGKEENEDVEEKHFENSVDPYDVVEPEELSIVLASKVLLNVEVCDIAKYLFLCNQQRAAFHT